jgi:protein FAM50
LAKYSEPATQTGAAAGFRKRKKGLKKGGLSFGGDEEAEDNTGNGTPASTRRARNEDSSDAAPPVLKKKGLKPNSSVSFQPKAMTKSALLRDAQLKESLRRDYLQIQDAVKATEFMLPFVFFDGKISGGGTCRMKKGDFIWLFLDRARKVGAESAGRDGPGGSGAGRKDWARIGVDDLMLVRGDIVVPHVSALNGQRSKYVRSR